MSGPILANPLILLVEWSIAMRPIAAIGLVYGVLYRYFILKASPNLLFNYAVAGSFFMEFNSYEIDGTVLLGRLLASVVTYFVCIKFFFPILILLIKHHS